MKMIKKITVILLALVLIFSVGACSKKDSGGDGSTTPPPPENQLPEYDGLGNKYVDPVKEKDGFLTYEGMDSYLDKGKYGEFVDRHSADSIVSPYGKPLNEVIGFVHAGGQYNFSDMPYMNEGSGMINKDLKSKTVKLFLTNKIKDDYLFNHDFNSNADSIVDIFNLPDVKKVFNEDFSTYIIVTYEYNNVNWSARSSSGSSVKALSGTDKDYVKDEFYKLSKELLRSYNTTGKTFILQNWEGDNELTPALKSVDGDSALADKATAKTQIINNYIDYNNARIAGIKKARDEIGTGSDVKVYGALELNYISYNGGGQSKLIDVVVPKSQADLFSFSDWSTDNAQLSRDLDTFNNATPKNNPDFADWNIYLGEYGRAEHINNEGSEDKSFEYSIDTMKIAVNKGVRYVCYWTLMCNERVGGENVRPDNTDMKGFWLVKPDGNYTKTFWYFKGLLENKDYLKEIPKVVMRVPESGESAIPLVEEDIIFQDRFDSKDSDGNFSIEHNSKFKSVTSGMRYDYVKEKDRPLFASYIEKYNLPREMAYTLIQKKETAAGEESITYDVVREAGQKDGKLVMQGFIFDPTPKSMIKVMVSEDGKTYEDIKSAYLVDKTGTYGYLYVTTLIPEKYTSAKIVFNNAKAGNLWDPSLLRVAFLK